MGVKNAIHEALERSITRISYYADMTIASLNEVHLVGALIDAMRVRGITIAEIAHAEGSLTIANIKLSELRATPVGYPLFFRRNIKACREAAINAQLAVIRSWTAALAIVEVSS